MESSSPLGSGVGVSGSSSSKSSGEVVVVVVVLGFVAVLLFGEGGLEVWLEVAGGGVSLVTGAG